MEAEGAQRVLIDTNVLIFSFKAPSGKGDTEKARHDEAQRRNTMRLLEDCRRQGREVVVASVSVSEALERMPPKSAFEMFLAIDALFPIMPFTADAAFLAAQLATMLHGMDLQDKPDKVKLRNDLYILSTGIQSECAYFYTTDKNLVKQAARLSLPIQVCLLQDAPSN